MNLDYPTLIGELDEEKRIRFYEILAHNLTVTVRGIWSDEHLTDAQKIEAMKWINEIMHRVVMKAALLRLKQNEHSESDTWQIIKDWALNYPIIESHVEWAIKSSYKSVS